MDRISEHLHGEKLGAWFTFWTYRDLVGEKKAKLTPTDEMFAAYGKHLTYKNRVGFYDPIRENYRGNILRLGTFTDASGLAQ